jgi:hypothetical protein
MGIASMRARAEEAGAALTIRSSPGRGATITVAVPCERHSARGYAWKAASWAAALLMFVVALLWKSGAQFLAHSPILIAVLAISVIGVARHGYVAYQLRHRPAAG